jgi:hypothetical protein
MNKKLFILPIVACLAVGISGCKIEVEKQVSLKQLLNNEPASEIGYLNVEVAGCHDYEDSRKPSDSLVEAQEKIPQIFPNAKFKECYTKKMDSFASFEIPVFVGKYEQGKTKTDDINVLSDDDDLKVATSANTAKAIAKQAKYDSSLELGVYIEVVNDLDKDVTLDLSSVYVNGKTPVPVPDGNMKLEKGKSVQLKLSNVSADSLWNTISKDGSGLVKFASIEDDD